ncbi:cell division protein ZipA [Methylovulum miyakonense]|uniref:cell division protein ZipA C-terminal FtsZ-binding domain-containing protein n=1 Tax=Methylovulum miyakonense TaxID=645578 RepID=UPI00036F4A21|nr:cell division protein ZipA C-terminal FtsZ-binding domain-containing protein [Methylovulum miyakonense]
MDKELLRVVIIASGLIIIVGMLAWHFFKNKKSFQDMMFFGNQEIKGKIDPAIVVNTGNDDFDVVPKPKKKLIDTVELLEKIKAKPKPGPTSEQPVFEADEDQQMFGDFDFANEDYADEGFPHTDGPAADSPQEELPEESIAPRFIAPDIIQFRVLAKSPEGFNGLDMLKAFRIAQLEYGNLKIFERFDANHLVDFGVLCMVDPGTFPDHDLDQFYCPGLVFFMQPALLDDAVKVFDDFLEAINIVAVELDGSLLDHEKNPLTNATIKMIRQSL